MLAITHHSQLTTSIHWPCYCTVHVYVVIHWPCYCTVHVYVVIHLPCYCTVHVYVVIHFCDSMWSFEWKLICAGFISVVYICIAVGDPVIKRGGLGSH